MQTQNLMDQMIALSGKKLEMLSQLKKLSEKQNEAFTQRQLDEVEQILNKKDEIISYIEKLDDAFLKLSDALKNVLGINSLTQLENTDIEGKNELRELIGKITVLVDDIINIEKLGYENALNFQTELGKEIKQLNAGKKITNAYYTKPLDNHSYFIDKKK